MIWQLFACVLLLICLFVFPQASHYGAEQGLSIFLDLLLPYLLPYLLLTTWLFSILNRTKTSTLTSFVVAYVTSAIGGYPVGAIATVSLYEQGLISKRGAQWLLPFLHSPNPFFVINFVGVDLLHNVRFSVYYLILHHLLSILAVCIIYKKSSTQKATSAHIQPISLQMIFEKTAFTTLTIAMTIIFFSSFTYITAQVLKPYTSISILTFLIGALELTNGLQFAYSYLPVAYLTTYFAFLLSSQGLSIHLQVAAVAGGKGFSWIPYIFVRILFTILFTLLFV